MCLFSAVCGLFSILGLDMIASSFGLRSSLRQQGAALRAGFLFPRLKPGIPGKSIDNQRNWHILLDSAAGCVHCDCVCSRWCTWCTWRSRVRRRVIAASACRNHRDGEAQSHKQQQTLTGFTVLTRHESNHQKRACRKYVEYCKWISHRSRGC
jgi:hypothetical protein